MHTAKTQRFFGHGSRVSHTITRAIRVATNTNSLGVTKPNNFARIAHVMGVKTMMRSTTKIACKGEFVVRADAQVVTINDK